ncbi:MAG: hypothetical protein Q9168_007107 [Polycauliona sp. 1 TL-2023]
MASQEQQRSDGIPNNTVKLPSALARHRILSPSAGVRVSPLCLGAANFGDEWKGFMGECSKETSFEILDYFYKMGGNFIDTAINYQNQQSERWLGEWMDSRGCRDEMVLATKYCGSWQLHGDKMKKIQTNFGGTATKNMYLSVEESLKNLRTSYIDLVRLDHYPTCIHSLSFCFFIIIVIIIITILFFS